MSQEFKDFLYTWQGLIGSGLGIFIAILLPLSAYNLRALIQKKQKISDSRKRVEISVSQSINDLVLVREYLKEFLERVKSVSDAARQDTNPIQFFLHETHFSPVLNVSLDTDLPKLKVNSHYLINKILIADRNIRFINQILEKMEEQYYTLIKKNELLISLMSANKGYPADQKIMYAQTLENFSDAMKSFTFIDLEKILRILFQVKIFNTYLLTKNKTWFWWKFSPKKFNFFLHKQQQREFLQNSIKFIDFKIEDEVKKGLESL